MKPDAIQNTTRLAIASALVRNSRANHLSWIVAERCPTACRRVLGTIPVAAIQGCGSPVTPRRNSVIAVVRIGGTQPSQLEKSPSLAARQSIKAGSVKRGMQAET